MGLHVAVEAGMTPVHEQQHAERRRRPMSRSPRRPSAAAMPEILPRQRFEGLGRGRAAARISISRKIYEVERALARRLQPVDVQRAGLAGRRTRARDARGGKSIHQRRFAHVGPAHQRKLREPVTGIIRWLRRTSYEFGAHDVLLLVSRSQGRKVEK